MSYCPVALCCNYRHGYPCHELKRFVLTSRLHTSDTSIQTWGHWLQWGGTWSFSTHAPHWLQPWWYQRWQGNVFSLLYAEWPVILYYQKTMSSEWSEQKQGVKGALMGYPTLQEGAPSSESERNGESGESECDYPLQCCTDDGSNTVGKKLLQLLSCPLHCICRQWYLELPLLSGYSRKHAATALPFHSWVQVYS